MRTIYPLRVIVLVSFFSGKTNSSSQVSRLHGAGGKEVEQVIGAETCPAPEPEGFLSASRDSVQ